MGWRKGRDSNAQEPGPQPLSRRCAAPIAALPGSRSGIRTHGTFRLTRFRSGHFRPLSHPTWQRIWDSNPCSSLPNRLAFQASALNHSANSLIFMSSHDSAYMRWYIVQDAARGTDDCFPADTYDTHADSDPREIVRLCSLVCIHDQRNNASFPD